ncbi:tape measure protein [Brevundimonas sp.]|uniref:tape measure protein n=1 Tax=Brevundimonas sp. TaxID=1871086 RepID=UPI003D6D55AB
MSTLNLRVLIQAVDRATAPIRRIARSLRIELPSAARIGGAALSKLTGLAAKAGAALGALAGIGFGAMTTGVIRTGAKFEQFAAVLETIEGSSDRARSSMRWVENFAKTTPYELDQVMEAFVALRAYGIDPTDGSLRTLGDAASAMNKPLMQAVEMLADAQTGEFERMKEFGVRGSAAGKAVSLTYQKAGREVTVTSRKAANEIRTNILSIFDSRFQGAMDRQAGTMKGLWSNLMDMVTSFQRQIADAGVFDFIKNELTALLATINQLSASGKLAKWAKEISDAMVGMFTTIKKATEGVDWVGAIKGLFGFIGGCFQLVKAIGGISGIITGGGMVAIAWLTHAAMGLGVAIATALGVATAPVAAVIAAIGLIGLAGFLLWRNWDSIMAGLKKAWTGFVDFLGGVWEGVKSVFKRGVDLVWKALPPWFRMILKGAGFVLKVATNAVNNVRPGGAATGGGAGPWSDRPRPAVSGGARRTEVGGAIDVRIRSDGHAQVTRVQSTNPAVPVQTVSAYRGANGR